MAPLILVLADIFAWLGSFLFITGGVKFYAAFSTKPQMIELNQWGLCFIPFMLIALFAPKKISDLNFTKVLTPLWRRLASEKIAQSICMGLAMLHFLGMYNRYISFVANWDLAIYANACANQMHSSLRNNLSLLADHFEPALALVGPICEMADPPIVLLATQVIAWTIGALGIGALAKSMKWEQSSILCAQMLYMLFSGHQTVSYYDFHLYGWSLATIPWIMYALQTRKTGLFALLIVFHLMLKENTSLFVAGLGLWMLLHNRKRSGLIVTVAGLTAFILIMKVIYPHFRGGVGTEYFVKYYGYIGKDFSSFIWTCLTKPWIPLQALLSLPRLTYYALILAPFLFFPLLSPSYLLPVAGSLLVNALSSGDALYSAGYHYEAEIYPWFFASTVVLLKDPIIIQRWHSVTNVLRLRQNLNPIYAWLTVLAVFFSGVTPLGQVSYYATSKVQATVHSELRKLAGQLKGCSVATVDRITPHLTDIPQLLTMDRIADANAVIVAYPQGDRLWMTSVEEIETKLAPQLDQTFKRFQPLNYDASFRVWTKEPCRRQ